MKKVLKNLIGSFVISIILLFIGLTIGFFFFVSLFDNPSYNNLSSSILLDPLSYEQLLRQSGYYDPLFFRFMRYILDFITGNWGSCYVFVEGVEVSEFLKIVTPRTIEVFFLPILLGLGVGIILRKFMKKNRKKRFVRLIQIFLGIGISIPLFSIIFTLQMELDPFLEVLYWKSPIMQNPPDITGFPLFDSIISGNWEIASDIFMHYLLPVLSLSLVIIPLFALQARSPIENESIHSNSLIIGKNILYLFIYLLIMEISFHFSGFGFNLYMSLILGDLFIINGYFYLSLLLICIVMLISNLIFTIYNGYKSEELRRPKFLVKFLNKTVIDQEEKQEDNLINFEEMEYENDKNDPEEESSLKDFIIKKLKTPPIIIGLVIISFAIFISVFPNLITQYSLSQVTPPYISYDTPYLSPTINHLLGTTRYGYDLGALLIWGTRDALIFCGGAVLIGLAGGMLFGFLTTLNKWLKNAIMTLMIVVYIIPAFFLLIPIINYYYQMALFGILLIPSFTRVIAQTKFKKKNIQTILCYIPREFLLIFILYNAVVYLGFGFSSHAPLGRTYSYGFTLYSGYWFTLWPGITIFTLSIGFYSLYVGLKPSMVIQAEDFNENTSSKLLEPN